MTDDEFMALALDEARRGDAPYGAVLVKEGEILARGFNTVERDHDATAHAEVNVIRAALARRGATSLEGVTLYTTGEPCAMCAGAAVWARISRVVYGASVAQLAEAGQHQIHLSSRQIIAASSRDIAVRGGVRALEALALFD